MRFESEQIVNLVSVFLKESEKHLKFFTHNAFSQYLSQKSSELSKEDFLNEDEFLKKFIKDAEKKGVLVSRKKAKKEGYKNLSNFELNVGGIEGKYEFNNFSCAKFVKFMFDRPNLSFGNFKNTIFNESIFRISGLLNSNFLYSSINDSYILSSNFKYSCFEYSNFNNTKIKKSFFCSSDFTNALFKNCNINDSVFRVSNLNAAVFSNSEIVNLSFEGTNLKNVYFKNCNIYGCDFKGAYNLDTIIIDEKTETDSPVLLEMIEKSKKATVVS